MQQEIQDLLVRCRSAMLVEPNHCLAFALRRELLRNLGPLILDSRGYGRELGIGKKRRTELAWRCANQVVAAWDDAFHTPALRNLLQLVRDYLDGRGGTTPIESATDSLQGALYNDPQGHDAAYLAGRATCACGWVAVGDEMLVGDAGVSQAELDDPQDPDLWDPAFFAAAAHAKGIPGAPHFSRDRMREFWKWYLDIAVPEVCQQIV